MENIILILLSVLIVIVLGIVYFGYKKLSDYQVKLSKMQLDIIALRNFIDERVLGNSQMNMMTYGESPIYENNIVGEEVEKNNFVDPDNEAIHNIVESCSDNSDSDGSDTDDSDDSDDSDDPDDSDDDSNEPDEDSDSENNLANEPTNEPANEPANEPDNSDNLDNLDNSDNSDNSDNLDNLDNLDNSDNLDLVDNSDVKSLNEDDSDITKKMVTFGDPISVEHVIIHPPINVDNDSTKVILVDPPVVKKKNKRKSPSVSPRDLGVGTIMKSQNDGNNYVVKENSNGVKRWSKIKN